MSGLLSLLIGTASVKVGYSLVGISVTGFRSTWGTPAGGAIAFWNQMAQEAGMRHFFLLPRYQGETGLIWFTLLALVAMAILAWFVLRTRNSWLLILFVVPPIALGLWLRVEPDFPALALLFGSLFLGYGYMKHPEGRGFGGILRFSSAFFLFAFLLHLMVGPITGSLPENWNQTKINLEEGIEGAFYGKNPLGEGRLSWEKRPEQKGEALMYRGENNRPEYLRGFVASNYKGNHWEPLEPGAYYEQENLMYWLHQEGFGGLGQLAHTQRLLSEEVENNSVTIRVTGANKKYAYTTYGMTNLSLKKGKNWGDSFITGKYGLPLKEYTYTQYDELWQQWPTLAGNFFSHPGEEPLKKYAINESHYNREMYDRYTYISEKTGEVLYETLGSRGNQEKGHVDYKLAIEKVTDSLEQNFLYTENGPGKGSKENIYTFFREKKGYDVHFASAAVLMFRYYGIPARYVEGYIVTPEEVEENPNQEISVPLDHCHAWPEIYIDSMGWVPVEVSPPYKKIMPQPDYSKGIEVEDQTIALGEPSFSFGEEEETLFPSSAPRRNLWSHTFMVILLGLLALILTALFLKRRVPLWKESYRNEKNFRGKDVTLAACYLYQAMKQRKWILDEKTEALGNKAAYSGQKMTEEERQYLLDQWKQRKEEARKVEREQKEDRIYHYLVDVGHIILGKLPWRTHRASD